MADRNPARASDLTVPAKISLWALALLTVSIAIHTNDLRRPGHFRDSINTSDFMRLYVTGALADQGRWGDLYNPDAHLALARSRVDPRLAMTGLHPNYGPSAAVLLAPLSRLPFVSAWVTMTVLTIVVYLLAVMVAIRIAGYPSHWRQPLLLLSLAFPALSETVRYGQLSGLTTALFFIAGALYCRRRDFAAGVFVGLVFYKPNLVVPALALALLAREWRLAAGVVAGALAHLSIGLIAAGLAPTLAWLDVLSVLARDPRQVQDFTADAHSIHGFLRLIGATPPLLGWISGAGSMAIMGVAVWHWDRLCTRDRWATLALVTVLVSPHLLTYDLLLLAVPLVFAVRFVATSDKRQPWRVALIAGLYFCPLISPRVAQFVPIQLSTLLTVGLLLAIALARTDQPGTPART